MKEIGSFEKSGNTCPTTQRHIPKDFILQEHRCQKFKTRVLCTPIKKIEVKQMKLKIWLPSDPKQYLIHTVEILRTNE